MNTVLIENRASYFAWLFAQSHIFQDNGGFNPTSHNPFFHASLDYHSCF